MCICVVEWLKGKRSQFVSHLSELDNPRIHHVNPLSDGVYQRCEALRLAGQLKEQFLSNDNNPQVSDKKGEKLPIPTDEGLTLL